ncbi:Urease accessory protein UreF [Corchorus capsularis]|uniref:Urease accessory protein UreF n=1 Tax=Corchorus capsularis TaxID=210143 RepID=A0A1R3IQX4_COCAP|nr:Urease accessory protein UreF [Corchorus capsularis]
MFGESAPIADGKTAAAEAEDPMARLASLTSFFPIRSLPWSELNRENLAVTSLHHLRRHHDSRWLTTASSDGGFSATTTLIIHEELRVGMASGLRQFARIC